MNSTLWNDNPTTPPDHEDARDDPRMTTTEENDMTGRGFIATDKGGPDHWLVIYGVGQTPEAAVEDAGQWEDFEGREVVEGGYTTLLATERLIARVLDIGGDPDDVKWTVAGGVADLLD